MRPVTEHGTRGMYAKGCRCDACKARERERHKAWRDRTGHKQAKRIDHDASDFPHGVSGYSYGCRCEVCKSLDVERRKQYKPKNHGMSGYTFGCRCDVCRTAKQQYDATPHRRAVRRDHVRRRQSRIKACDVKQPKLIAEIYKHCPQGYEVDHIVAVSRGGEHAPDNLQYLPATVNRQKNASNMDVSEHIIRWQDVLEAGSTTIP